MKSYAIKNPLQYQIFNRPAAAWAALCRSGVHDLRVVTRSYSLSQLFAAEKTRDNGHILGRFQSVDRLITTFHWTYTGLPVKAQATPPCAHGEIGQSIRIRIKK